MSQLSQEIINNSSNFKKLMSDEYHSILLRLHESNDDWGTSGHTHKTAIINIIESHGYDSVLDFGCGKGTLISELKNQFGDKVRIDGFDPCVKKYAKNFYLGAQLVVCTDVLEHIEPNMLDSVLEEIGLRSTEMMYFVISLVPARQLLEDGRNAHLIIQPKEWWTAKLEEHFPHVLALDSNKNEAVFICATI